MSFWKVVAGAAAGVGVVAALPVFGPIGAVTAAGAAVGALIGGVGGALASSKEDVNRTSEHSATHDAGVNAGKAEYQALVDALVQRMQQMQSVNAVFEQRVLALFAVGFAVAASDGPITPEESAVIGDFVGGASVKWQAEHLRARVATLAEKPPTFGEAMAMVDAAGDPAFDDAVTEMIEIAIAVDGGESSGETAFREAWRLHRADRAAASA